MNLSPYHPGLAAVSVACGIAVVAVSVAVRRRTDVDPTTPLALVAVIAIAGAERLTTAAPVAAMGALALVALGGVRRRGAAPSPAQRGVVAAGCVSSAGVWAAVPDTEMALVVAAVMGVSAVGVSFLADPSRVADRTGRLVWAAAGALAAVAGGRGTPQLPGGLAAAALLAAFPSTVRAVPPSRAVRRLVVAHAVAVVVASRIVTRWETPGSVIASVAIVASFAALSVAVGRGRFSRDARARRGRGSPPRRPPARRRPRR